MKHKIGFTLAEILITLVIIGVVAAMTIPTLIAKINDIVTTNQAKVFNAKLIKGLNLTKTAGDLNDTYNSTYDFLVNGLGKNLKMAKVCDASHLRDCIPYDKIKFDKADNTEDTINVSEIITGKKLKLGEGFTDTAAFVLADGTPAIVSYNLKCIDDPDKADTEINACLAGIYDINGTRKPNKFGTKVEAGKTSYIGDLRSFNGARVGYAGIITAQDGTKIYVEKTAVYPKDIWRNYFDEIPTYTDSDGNEQSDYWTVAKKYCDVEGGRLPTQTELQTIAQVLYDRTNIPASGYQSGVNYNNNKPAVFSALGIEMTTVWFSLWSDTTNGADKAYVRDFSNYATVYGDVLRSYSFQTGSRIVCLE